MSSLVDSIDCLPLPPGCKTALHKAGVHQVGDLALMTEDQLMLVKGIGPFYYHEIERLMKKLGAELI